MGLIAVYTVVDNDTLNGLKKLDNKDLIDTLENSLDDEIHQSIDIDKMWDGLHFLLTGSSASEPIPDDEKSEFVVGTSLFSEDEDDDFISFSTSKDITRIIEKVKKTNLSKLKQSFSPESFAKSEIYPDIWSGDSQEALWDELESAFVHLLAFYEKNKKMNVVVSIY